MLFPFNSHTISILSEFGNLTTWAVCSELLSFSDNSIPWAVGILSVGRVLSILQHIILYIQVKLLQHCEQCCVVLVLFILLGLGSDLDLDLGSGACTCSCSASGSVPQTISLIISLHFRWTFHSPMTMKMKKLINTNKTIKIMAL